MTSLFAVIFFIGEMEVGYITGKTEATCDHMNAVSEAMSTLWGQKVDAACRNTYVPFIRPMARPW